MSGARLSRQSEDDQLTTGTAALILGCSRQHIVDLCKDGRLPFTTIGTHRRVRRSDIATLRGEPLDLQRSERRSLWLSYAVAGAIVSDPDRARDVARQQLERMRGHVRGGAHAWLDQWSELLDGPTSDLLSALTEQSPTGNELRQNSPFAGMLTDDQRSRALAAWRDTERGQ